MKPKEAFEPVQDERVDKPAKGSDSFVVKLNQDKILELASIGMSPKQISDYLDLDKDLSKNDAFMKLFFKGRANGIKEVLQKNYEQAKGGKDSAVKIFTQHVADWNPKTQVEHSGQVGNKIEFFLPKPMKEKEWLLYVDQEQKRITDQSTEKMKELIDAVDVIEPESEPGQNIEF